MNAKDLIRNPINGEWKTKLNRNFKNRNLSTRSDFYEKLFIRWNWNNEWKIKL